MKTHEVQDYVIVGAGPAGLQLGYFFQKSGRSYQILEASQTPGAFFGEFPRHRTLLSINKVHTGSRSEPEFDLRHDWNSLLTYPEDTFLLRKYTREYFPQADALHLYLKDFAQRFGLNIRCGVKVTRVERPEQEGPFVVESESGETWRCQRLIVTTGLARPYVPSIPGIELAEGYETVSIDREDFAGQTVLILGKGNSAFETANHLIGHAAAIHLASPHPVKMAWDTHFVGHVRAINNHFLDTYLLKSQNGVLDGNVQSIERMPSGKLRVRWSSIHTEMDEEIEQFEYDRVIRCTGFRFDDSIFGDSCRPALAHGDRLPQLTGAWESENVPGLYFGGTLMQTLDYKKSQSSFIHGFRYNIRTLFHLLEARYHGIPLPHDRLDRDPEAIAAKVIQRANHASSLWQQVGFLCDLVRFPAGTAGPAEWYYDLNPKYVMEQGLGAETGLEYYLVMMKYGPCAGTVFNHPHVHPHESGLTCGELTTEIHPVVSRYSGRTLQTEYHVRTDFMADWESGFYRQPLLDFLTADLTGNDLDSSLPKPTRRELIRNSNMRFSRVTFDGIAVSVDSPGVAQPPGSREEADAISVAEAGAGEAPAEVQPES